MKLKLLERISDGSIVERKSGKIKGAVSSSIVLPFIQRDAYMVVDIMFKIFFLFTSFLFTKGQAPTAAIVLLVRTPTSQLLIF